MRTFRFVTVTLAACAAACAAESPIPATPYEWHNVAIGGGGFVSGVVAHPRQAGLMYARTDVGGAYRWEPATQRWIPLMDWVSEADWNLMGVESIALDPNDPRRLYVAAGTYSRFPAAMLRSEDQGRTFQRTNVPFGMGGNELGRFDGERLAVDPNEGAILFFGSRRDGLWRSGDHGQAWTRVTSFPQVDEAPSSVANREGVAPAGFWTQPVGIVAVAFDAASGKRGSPTPAIYAAVSTPGTSLFRSEDAGKRWTPVAHQPTGFRPNHLALAGDGALYLSYSREPGPGGPMTGGAVWKLDPKNGAWTDISPLKDDADRSFGYGCVAVDAQHPQTVIATTFSRWKPHDQIFRSTDGGATWRALWDDDTARWDYAGAPYTATRRPHWLGTVVIDPFDSDHVLFTTGYGIWSSADLGQSDAGRPTHWTFTDDGLEETVPLALVSPPTGAHLVSGEGDIDGFRHDDVEMSPPAGSFSGPRFASTRDLVFAAQAPERMARIGNAGRDVAVHVAMSGDGGRTWEALASDPPQGGSGMGRIALNSDGTVLVWSELTGTAFVTADAGKTWTPCAGLAVPVSLAADPREATRLYAFDPKTGSVLVSTDAGRHFEPAGAPVPGDGPAGRGDVLAVTPDRSGDVWVGSRAAGLQHSTDGGATFARLAGVEAADALGFGMPAPRATHPALYLRGKIHGLQAFYRSDDAGRTWVRINDDAHQFGAANRPLIIGDPRVYGRVYLSTGGRGIIYGQPK